MKIVGILNMKEDKSHNWPNYIAAMTAVAILSTVGSELSKWAIEHLKEKYSTKKSK